MRKNIKMENSLFAIFDEIWPTTLIKIVFFYEF